MEILIQAKKSAADPQIKAYAQAKLEKLARHFDHILEARMELGTEKNKSLENMKVAELTVHVTGRTGNILKAVQSAGHMNEAVDLVIDKMDRQIRHHKEKLKDHRRAKPAVLAAQAPATPGAQVRPNGVRRSSDSRCDRCRTSRPAIRWRNWATPFSSSSMRTRRSSTCFTGGTTAVSGWSRPI